MLTLQLGYTSLHADETRLIKFSVGDSYDHIALQLEHFHLRNAPPYLAQSYVWGSPDVKKQIFVHGQPLLLTENLHAALTHLQPLSSFVEEGVARASAELYLQVDAICINQKSLDEKISSCAEDGAGLFFAR